MNDVVGKRTRFLGVRIRIFSNLQELAAAPRRFLFFIVFNVVSWQCIVGPALVLLARKIDMPPSYVGFLISFMPLSMVLVLVTGQLVLRLGPKRVMFTAWMLRNLISCVVFLMPWAMWHYGARSGWWVLMAATLGFCLMRAIGAGGWFPWLHEVVPETQRAAYFSAEGAVGQFLNVAVMLGQGLILRNNPSLGRFLIIYGIGIASGMFSLAWMARVPGGLAVKAELTINQGFESYRRALRDGAYMRFVINASLCFSATSWLGSAGVMYLKDAVGLSSAEIMYVMALGSVGIMLTIRYWGRFTEHSGSGSSIFLTLTGHSLAALAALLLIPGMAATRYALYPVFILAATFNGAMWMATHRAMFNSVAAEDRIGYTNIFTVGTSMALGITPILVGLAIDHWGMWGYRFCFIMAGLLGFACAVASRYVCRDSEPLDMSLARLLNPTLPARTVGRIFWVSMGLHESNR